MATKTSIKKWSRAASNFIASYSISFNSWNVCKYFWSWILKDYIKVQEKQKESCCFANINLVLLRRSCSRRRRRCLGKPRNTLCLLSSTAYLFNQNLTYVFYILGEFTLCLIKCPLTTQYTASRKNGKCWTSCFMSCSIYREFSMKRPGGWNISSPFEGVGGGGRNRDVGIIERWGFSKLSFQEWTSPIFSERGKKWNNNNK